MCYIKKATKSSQANSRQPHNDLKLYQSDMIVIFGVKHLDISQKDSAKKNSLFVNRSGGQRKALTVSFVFNFND